MLKNMFEKRSKITRKVQNAIFDKDARKSTAIDLAVVATLVGGHLIKINMKSASDVVGNVITMRAPYKGKNLLHSKTGGFMLGPLL